MPNKFHVRDTRQIVCQYRGCNNQFKVFDDTHQSYDPLAYPLFYPFGNDGWHINLKCMLNEYIAHRMAPRANVFNVHHHGNRLYQQWLVDQFCKMEMAQMKWA